MQDRVPEESSTGSFKTNDGLELRYVESGTGAPLVLVHGWSHGSHFMFMENPKKFNDIVAGFLA